MTDSQTAEAGASFAPFFPSNRAAAPGEAPQAPDPAPPRSLDPDTSLVAPDLDNSISETNHIRHDGKGDWEAPSAEGRRISHRGWTPERERLFHETLAQTGVVLEAARAAGMSAHAAYALRNRDPLFDAGWEAALTLARRRLADDLYARAVKGVVEQIHRDGAVVAERHRYDNRLSMAVLTRLDARLDRAEARDDAHLRVAARWDEYLDALEADRADDARALLAPPELVPAKITDAVQHCDPHDVGYGDEDAEVDAEDEDEDPDANGGMSVWKERGEWRTDFPPPADFDGYEEGEWGVDDDYYRDLTPAEQAIYDAADASAADAALAEASRLRDLFFGFIVEEEKDASAQDAQPAISHDEQPDPPKPG